jgi:Flp pilus assembly protein TadG
MNESTTTRNAATTRGCRARSGVLTVEMILVIPILLAVVLALVQFGVTLMSMQGISAAARVGTRQATLPSATQASVEAAVAQVLAGWHFAGNETTEIFVNGLPVSAANPLTNAVTGDAVAVRVTVPTSDAVPDLLKFVGGSIVGQTLKTEFVLRKE